MDFKNERLMMSKEEARNRAKELFNENQVDLITKYMFLEQQCKKQKEVIGKAKNHINDKFVTQGGFTSYEWNDLLKQLLDILKEVSE